ncbi:TrkH family potassium uptake protein [Butyrivibrio sp. YAB3001]|uniref:TrkH family potassium uptake protein n=1 Tax=Butyrivibrio sp. YAB3001 TaxID=1520812 RepID=UPI0008F66DC5|nr:potassium transporter TrkG [Butyrivibrio sp. YAB3001]SFC48417.1 trk system potassium uptake protein TrkH [Butyrivibrio sp. YAB3001]
MFFLAKTKGIKLAPVQIIPLSFLITIVIGALLLTLPVASASGEGTSFLTALFTATTSVCVTGLVVVDTYAHWSFVGQLIILVLVQIGGLGMIAIASMLMVLIGKKFSLTDRMLLRDAFNLNSESRLLSFLVRVLKGTFLVEGIGALLYAIDFIPAFGIKKGLWCAIFNAVSAFCNAGMDVIGPNSMGDYRNNPLVMSVTMILIITGGIGFVVWFDVVEKIKEGYKKRFSPLLIINRFSEHTKLVLSFTLILLFGGMIIFTITEFNNSGTIGNMNLGEKLVNSLFESVTLRTAGFASYPQENLSYASCMVAYVLMFIGGSPIGTAGGIKTVTMFLLIMNLRTYVSHQNEKVIFGRRVSEDSMRKASAITFVGVVAVFILTILLLMLNPVPMEDALFEVVSACATVGLSRGLTSTLGIAGRIIIIIAMFLGRIGPISMVAFFSRDKMDSNKINYSEGIFYVG